MKKQSIIKLAAAALLVILIGASQAAQPLQAHTKCKISWPGGWTEGCPHFHPPPEQPSCLSFMTETFYEFRISNKTGNTVNYRINEERFYLYDGRYRNHKYRKTYGTSSCNVTSYAKPVIKFDYSYNSGYQARSYTVGTFPVETFQRSGSGIDLYH